MLNSMLKEERVLRMALSWLLGTDCSACDLTTDVEGYIDQSIGKDNPDAKAWIDSFHEWQARHALGC